MTHMNFNECCNYLISPESEMTRTCMNAAVDYSKRSYKEVHCWLLGSRCAVIGATLSSIKDAALYAIRGFVQAITNLRHKEFKNAVSVLGADLSLAGRAFGGSIMLSGFFLLSLVTTSRIFQVFDVKEQKVEEEKVEEEKIEEATKTNSKINLSLSCPVETLTESVKKPEPSLEKLLSNEEISHFQYNAIKKMTNHKKSSPAEVLIATEKKYYHDSCRFAEWLQNCLLNLEMTDFQREIMNKIKDNIVSANEKNKFFVNSLQFLKLKKDMTSKEFSILLEENKKYFESYSLNLYEVQLFYRVLKKDSDFKKKITDHFNQYFKDSKTDANILINGINSLMIGSIQRLPRIILLVKELFPSLETVLKKYSIQMDKNIGDFQDEKQAAYSLMLLFENFNQHKNLDKFNLSKIFNAELSDSDFNQARSLSKTIDETSWSEFKAYIQENLPSMKKARVAF